MREPNATPINYPLLFMVLAAHGWCLHWMAQPERIHFAVTRTTPAEQPQNTASAQARSARNALQTLAMDASGTATPPDPRYAFTLTQWQRNQQRAADVQLRAQWGDLSALLTSTPTRAVEQVVQRLQRGDRIAARAAKALQDECSSLPDNGTTALHSTPTHDLANGLLPGESATVRALFEDRLQRLSARQRRCQAWHRAQASLAAARAVYATTLTERVAFDVIPAQELPAPDDTTAAGIAASLRAYWNRNPGSDTTLLLATQLLQLDDPTQHAWALQLLQELARRDDRQVASVAAILRDGYARLPPQPQLALQWTQRAAALGDDTAIGLMAQRSAADGDTTTTWALHAWRIWLNANGCYVQASQANDSLLAADLRRLSELDRAQSRDTSQHAMSAYRLQLERWGPRARAARGCDD